MLPHAQKEQRLLIFLLITTFKITAGRKRKEQNVLTSQCDNYDLRRTIKVQSLNHKLEIFSLSFFVN